MLLVLSVAATAACASQGAVTPGAGTTRTADVTAASDGRYRVEMTAAGAGAVTIPRPADEVWAVLPAVYESIGLTGEVLDRERRVFGQREVTVRRRLAGAQVSRYLSCGTRAGMANADSYSVRVSVRTQAVPAGEASQVRTEIEAAARAPGSSDPWVRCGSTNQLERRIENAIRGLTGG
jgi:hypothetical protein